MWSKPFDCERAGTHQSIIWPGDGHDKMPHAKSRKRKHHNYDIFVSIDSGPYLNRLGLTRMVHIHPKYLVVNECVDDIVVCQRGTQDQIRCKPMEPVPVYFFNDPYVCIARAGQHWSPAIGVHRPCSVITATFKIVIDWRKYD